jgi:hypothetical protein
MNRRRYLMLESMKKGVISLARLFREQAENLVQKQWTTPIERSLDRLARIENRRSVTETRPAPTPVHYSRIAPPYL